MPFIPKIEEWLEGSTRHLSNGVTLWASSQKTAEDFGVAVGVKASVVDDPLDCPGLAHCFEHIPFRGAGKFDSNLAMSDPLEEYAGDCGASSYIDSTIFDISAAEIVLEHALDVICAMVISPHCSGIELEREAILREYCRNHNDPSKRAVDNLLEMMFPNSGWGRKILGSMESISSMTAEHLRSFHRQWYIGSNMFATVVGPYPPEKMLDLLEARLGSVPAGCSKDRCDFPEPQRGCYGSVWEFSEAAALMGIIVPATDERLYVLQMLDGMLDDGYSAPLNQQLRESNAYFYSYDFGWQPLAEYFLVWSNALISPQRTQEFWEDFWRIVATPEHLTPRRLEWVRHRREAMLKQARLDSNTVAVSAVKHLMQWEKVTPRNEQLARLLQVSLDDVHAFQKQFIQPQCALQLTIQPQT